MHHLSEVGLPFRRDCNDHEDRGRDGDVAHWPEDVGEEEEEPLRLAVRHRHAGGHHDEEDDLERRKMYFFSFRQSDQNFMI